MKVIALSFFFLLGTAALAQELASAPPITDWAPNETVVVSAAAPGPAFWHIKKGDSEVWILGTMGRMPRGTTWNRTRVTEIIDGARVVLAPAEATAGLFESSWFLLTHRGLLSMPGDQKLEDTLPPDLKARFAAARTALNLKADHFEDDPPVIAAWKLENNFNEQHKLGMGPGPAIQKIAKDNGVPMHPIGSYGALGLLKEVLRLPQDQQQACLRIAVADIEARAIHAEAAAAAWAVGDVNGIKAHYTQPFLPQCAGTTESFAKLYSRSVADYLSAIDEALSKPGKVVMMVEIGALLRNTGVIEKLHAQGLTIEGPAE